MTGKHEVRDACREDLPGLLAIYNDVVLTSTAIYTEALESLEQREAWWQQRTRQGYPVLVVRDGSGVLGFASFGDFRAWPGYRFTVEHSVHVRSDQRRQGVGTALLLGLIDRAVALRKHAMVGGIDAENTTSIRFHENLGFERVAHFREVGRKFDRWLDLVFLEKVLGSAP
ncbi:MAG TPA: GNAT family N-acetyltransferase [Chthoniobacterales bacterium]